VTAARQRAAADYLGEAYGVSQRRAGRVLGRPRSTLRFGPKNRSAQAVPLVQGQAAAWPASTRGGPLKWLSLVDEYTRECLALHVGRLVSGADVRRVLARVVGRRGGADAHPQRQRRGVYWRGAESVVAGAGGGGDPGGAGEPLGERLHRVVPQPLPGRVPGGRGVRDGAGREGARGVVRREYNTIRPHSSLGYGNAQALQRRMRPWPAWSTAKKKAEILDP